MTLAGLPGGMANTRAAVLALAQGGIYSYKILFISTLGIILQAGICPLPKRGF